MDQIECSLGHTEAKTPALMKAHMLTTNVHPNHLLPATHTCKAMTVTTASGIQLLDQYGGLREFKSEVLFENLNTHSPKELPKMITNTMAVTREGVYP